MTQSTPELLPCPWPECSSQPSILTETSSTAGVYQAQAFVECWDCGCRGPKTCCYKGPIGEAPKVLKKARAEGAIAWNTRIEHSTPDWNAVLEKAAKFVEGWNGSTRDGDTFLIAEELRALMTTTPEPTESAITSEWCLNMAQLEGDAEMGAGAVDHPLRCPPVSPEPTDPAGVSEMADELEAIADFPCRQHLLDEERDTLHKAAAILRTPDPVLEVVKEALRFYARGSTYLHPPSGGLAVAAAPISCDRGERARAALQTIKEGEGA